MEGKIYMAIYCKKCGNQLSGISKFCPKCGTKIDIGTPAVNTAVKKPAQSVRKNNKSHLKAIIAVVMVLVIIAAALGGVYFLYPSIVSHEKRLNKKLSKLTDKEVIEFYYDDFNADEIYEAFAVVGKSNGNSISKAEIWFISDNAGEKVKDNINKGKLNGILEDNNNKYISIEIENEDSTQSKSYIYTVDKKDKYKEPDISGEYSNVHMEDGKIVIDSGEELDIQEGKVNLDLLEATDAELRQLAQINQYFTSTNFDYRICDPKCGMQDYVLGIIVYLYYGYFSFDNSADVEYGSRTNVPDPLNRFTYSGNRYEYMKVPADKADWVLKNILNLEPDRTINNDDIYYKDGYYYRYCPAVGDGCSDYKYVSSEKLSDGRYKVILQPYYDKNYDFEKRELIVGLKNIDGKRVWSYYSVSDVKEIPSDAMTFNGNHYYIYKKSELTGMGNKFGGHLATITSKEEQKAVFDYVKKTAGDVDLQIDINPYQSLYMEKPSWEKVFYWTSTGEKYSYSNWGKNQPSNNGYYAVMCNGKRNINGNEIEPGQWYTADDLNNCNYCIYEWEKDF